MDALESDFGRTVLTCEEKKRERKEERMAMVKRRK